MVRLHGNMLILMVVFGLVSTAGTAAAQCGLMISQDFQDAAAWEAAKAAGDWSYFWYGSGAEYGSPVVDWPTTDPGAPAKGLELMRMSGCKSCAHVVYRKEGYTSEGGYNRTAYCDDVEGSVILCPVLSTGSVHAMVLVRNTKYTMKTNDPALGYAIGLVCGSSSTLVITEDPISHNNSGTELASLALTGDLRNTTLKLDFSAIGTTLAASLYAWDDEAEDFADPLGTVTVDDDTYTEGRVGLRMGASYYNKGAHFANFKAEVVPEPATVLLLAGGSLGVILRRKYGRRVQHDVRR